MNDVTNPINWQVKNIAEQAKTFALEQARAAEIPVGLWLEKVLMELRDGHAPAAHTLAPRIDLRHLAEIMQATALIVQASGRPVPKRTIASAYALLGQELRRTRATLAEWNAPAINQPPPALPPASAAHRLAASPQRSPAVKAGQAAPQ